jgi:hypothetical protein
MTAGVDCGDCVYTVKQDGTFGDKVAQLPHDYVYGLGFAAGKLYGFTGDGHAFALDPAAPSKVEEISVMGLIGYDSLSFTGAGSTTLYAGTKAN